jgi:hypothetical protein
VSNKINPGSENSLIIFLKDNEAVFTILGVFLVLAFIFNSVQIFTQSNSQNEPMQIQCFMNETNSSLVPNEGGTQINCTGYLSAGAQSTDKSAALFTNNSKSFSFICLWMALIVYLLICCNLYYALRDCLSKVGQYFSNKAPPDNEVFRDCAILFIIPFFYQAAVWFFSLLTNAFPDMTVNAFFLSMSVLILIQFIILTAVSTEINKVIQLKRKAIIFNLTFLLLGILLFCLAIFAHTSLDVLVITVTLGAGFFGFGFFGIYRFIKNKNTKEYFEVN